MGVRLLALVGLVGISAWAEAQTTFQSFEWGRNGKFQLQYVQNGEPLQISGLLYENSETHLPVQDDPATAEVNEQNVPANGVTLDINSYPEGFVSAIVTNDIDDNAYIFFMVRERNYYVPINQQAILGDKAMVPDEKFGEKSSSVGVLAFILENHGVGIGVSMRIMGQEFAANKYNRLRDFYDAVQLHEAPMIFVPKIGQNVLNGGVVQVPDGENRPPVLDIDDPVEEPKVVDGQVLIGDQSFPLPRPRPTRPSDPIVLPEIVPLPLDGQQTAENPPAENPQIETPSIIDMPVEEPTFADDPDDSTFIFGDDDQGDFPRPPMDIPNEHPEGYDPNNPHHTEQQVDDLGNPFEPELITLDGDEVYDEDSNFSRDNDDDEDGDWVARERQRQCVQRKKRAGQSTASCFN